MKKLISLVLAVIMILSCMPITALADEYYPACSYSGPSIVDGLNSLGITSTFDYRCEIAEANGIGAYEGSAEQNNYMLMLLKQGRLVVPGTQWSSGVQISNSIDTAPSILIGSRPCTDDIVEATKDTILRVKASKNADILCNVKEGDCFTVVDSVINKWDNLWYEVSWAGTTGFIYSGNVSNHIHYYEKVDDRLSICKCGVISVRSETNTVSYANAVSLNIDAIQAAAAVLAGTLETAGAVALEGVTVAAPVVTLVVAAGIILYIEVSSSGAQVEDVAIMETLADIENRLSKDGNDLFYRACTIPREGAIVIYKNGMNLNEAHKFLKYTATNAANIAISELTDTVICSIWTYDMNNATALAELWSRNGRDYGYGRSDDFNRMPEANKDKNGNLLAGYFMHYHLWFRPYNLFFLKKVDNAHIFWGAPIDPTTV